MNKSKKETVFLSLIIIFTLMLGFIIGINYTNPFMQNTQTQNVNITTEYNDNKYKINLNTATKKELMLLPSVGEVTAENIIKYRKTHGEFITINELLNIPNINRKTFENIKNRVEV